MKRFSSLKIYKQYLDNQQKEEIFKKLTFQYSDYSTGQMYTLNFYKETKNCIYIPKYIDNFLSFNFNEEIENICNSGDIIDIEDNIILRNKVQEDCVEAILKNETGIIKLPPGKGKTVMAIKAASILKRKFIVVVDMEKIKEQWINEIKKFTNLTDDDIGIIQGDQIDVVNKKCCIIMINTLSSRVKKGETKKYLEILNENNFGVCFYDEVHCLIGPEKFTDALYCIPTKRTYGLTATPNRTDGRLILLNYWLKDIIFKIDEYDIMPIINIINFSSDIKKTKTYKHITYGGKFNRMSYNKKLIDLNNYINTLDSVVEYVIKNNRICVFMSEIKKILEFFILRYSDRMGIENIGFFVGGSGIEEIDKKYVFTTYKMTNKAINNINWDCLIFLTSVGSPIAIEQSIGRTTRMKDGKRNPLIFDLVDNDIDVMKFLFKNRYKLYKEKKFNIKFINDLQNLHSEVLC